MIEDYKSVEALAHFLGPRQSWDLHYSPEFPWERVHSNFAWHLLLTGCLLLSALLPQLLYQVPPESFLKQLLARNPVLGYAFRCSIIYPKILEDLRRPSHLLSFQISNTSYLTHIPMALLPNSFQKAQIVRQVPSNSPISGPLHLLFFAWNTSPRHLQWHPLTSFMSPTSPHPWDLSCGSI